MADQRCVRVIPNRLLLTIPEAAERLAVSRSHVYDEFINRGRLRVVHIGRSARVVTADLEALVQQLASEAGEFDER
jgi:excisionase family DNA binding protein